MTMVRKLKSVTTQPTMSMSTLSGMCFVAIAAKGATAAESLYALPSEANVNGIRDMGAVPGAGAAGIGNVKALVVVGEHPAARPLVARVAGYDDVLKEVERRLTVDGRDSV